MLSFPVMSASAPWAVSGETLPNVVNGFSADAPQILLIGAIPLSGSQKKIAPHGSSPSFATFVLRRARKPSETMLGGG